MIKVSGEASRTAGSNSSFLTARETSYLSFSNPNDPAMPQQPGRRRGELHSHPVQNGLFIRHFHDRLVMTVAMNQAFALTWGRLNPLAIPLKKLAEQEGLLR